jgi:Ca2+-binding EF-hand superfamily protein
MLEDKPAVVNSTYLSGSEIKHFEKIFIELAGSEYGEMTFDNLKDIILTYGKLNRNVLNTFLEKVRKEIKSNVSNEYDGELVVSNLILIQFRL